MALQPTSPPPTLNYQRLFCIIRVEALFYQANYKTKCFDREVVKIVNGRQGA